MEYWGLKVDGGCLYFLLCTVHIKNRSPSTKPSIFTP
jgi:hypothetical protein